MELNIAEVVAAVAAAVPDRTAFVQGTTHLSYAELRSRAHQLAHVLVDRGLGCHIERAHLAGHQSGQDHLALYLYNGHEFLEGLIGSFAARVAPFNVNYRYVDQELVQLLSEQRATAVLYHSAFAPALARIRGQLSDLRLLLQVADDSGHALLPGAEWYADALAGRPTAAPPVAISPDDLYILCTGGTTGSPKGVLWRQADVFVAALSGASTRLGREYDSMAEVVEEAIGRGGRYRTMATAPYMHGAGQWSALTALTHGNTCVLPSGVRSLDPADVWRTAERERVTMLQIVGDAFARPLLDELDRTGYDLAALRFVMSSGATLSAGSKARLVAHLPQVTVVDGLGTSEAGATGLSTTTARNAPTATFQPDAEVCVLSADMTRPLEAGEDEVGWMATSGRLPLGYLGDEARTAATFPTLRGRRYAVTGDRARLGRDGRLRLLGRDSATVNTGGEKVFAEEVEQALLTHPAVDDVVVCGRPSERWGSEVVAVVAVRPGARVTEAELLASAGATIARYKLPKAIVFRPSIVRSPAGKPDYRWAAEQARS